MDKGRYLTLDALRGVAAIAVMLFHRRKWTHDGHVLEHAYLAVDFFFMLSGFVIAHAYEKRLLDGMKVVEFLRARLIRLYPLITLSVLVGLAFFTYNALRGGSFTMLQVLSVAPLALLALPQIPGMANVPFPINPPSWSIFFELAVNIGYAVLAPKLSTRVLIAIIAVAWCVDVVVVKSFGSLASVGTDFDSLIGALPRTVFPFFFGVLLYRLHRQQRLPRLRVPAWLLAVILVASFAPTPFKHGGVIYAVLCFSVLHPLIIIAGCTQPLHGMAAKTATTLADLSVPVYLLHFPLFFWMAALAQAIGVTPVDASPWFLLAAASTVIIISFIAAKYYDAPLRRWLKECGKRASTTTASDALAAPAE